MQILINLFWIGFWISVASLVFSIALGILYLLIAVVVGSITWLVEKVKE